MTSIGWRPEKQALGALDPRYDDAYDSISIHDKCVRMAEYLSALVRNMRPHLNLRRDTIADPNWLHAECYWKD